MRDVNLYGRFLIDAGTATGAANVASPDSLRQMREPVMPIPGLPIQMGRDWFVFGQPDLVIAAIQQVVDAVRDPSTWATPVAGTPPS